MNLLKNHWIRPEARAWGLGSRGALRCLGAWEPCVAWEPGSLGTCEPGSLALRGSLGEAEFADTTAPWARERLNLLTLLHFGLGRGYICGHYSTLGSGEAEFVDTTALWVREKLNLLTLQHFGLERG